jgi:hypothetical protein
LAGAVLVSLTMSGSASAAEKQPPLAAKRLASQAFGRCTALKNKAGAFKLLTRADSTAPVSKRDSEVMDPVFDYECGSRTLTTLTNGSVIASYRPWAFRGIVADGVVFQWFRKRGPTDFSAVPPLSYAEMPASPTAKFMANYKAEARSTVLQEWEDARTELALEGLAECATRKSPEQIRMLGFTTIDSPEERSLLRDVAPLLGSCLPQGVSFKMPLAALRGPLMIAYVRLAYPLSEYARSESRR